ncbi:hypothetical protein ACWDUL_08860 [Nocardia niigatensis]
MGKNAQLSGEISYRSPGSRVARRAMDKEVKIMGGGNGFNGGGNG